jgi:hypothetical protein
MTSNGMKFIPNFMKICWSKITWGRERAADDDTSLAFGFK